MASDDAKLFVAGLSDSISEDVLRQIFEATGGKVLSVSLPKDRATGRPRGFGFVTMSTSDEAQKARDALDGSLQAGRSISVRPFQADPPAKKAGGPAGPFAGGGGFGGAGPRIPEDERKLYIGNLPFDCSQEEVESIVQSVSAGGVVRVQLPMDADGRKRGFAFVTMTTPDVARAAVDSLQDHDVRGRRLNVKLAQPRGERPARPDFAPGGGGGFGGPPFGGGPPPFASAGGPAPRRTFDDKKKREGSTDEKGAPRKARRQERESRNARYDYDDDE